MGFDVRLTLRFTPSELRMLSVYTKRIGINQYFFYGLTFELSGGLGGTGGAAQSAS